MKILCLDYGRRHTGVAISNNKLTLATSLTTLHVKPKLLTKEILNICSEYQIKTILIGYPLGLDRKPTEMSKEIDEFITKLTKKTDLPIITWNETGTSQLGEENLNFGDSHAEAARIMLQEYLDNQNINKNEK